MGGSSASCCTTSSSLTSTSPRSAQSRSSSTDCSSSSASPRAARSTGIVRDLLAESVSAHVDIFDYDSSPRVAATTGAAPDLLAHSVAANFDIFDLEAHACPSLLATVGPFDFTSLDTAFARLSDALEQVPPEPIQHTECSADLLPGHMDDSASVVADGTVVLLLPAVRVLHALAAFRAASVVFHATFQYMPATAFATAYAKYKIRDTDGDHDAEVALGLADLLDGFPQSVLEEAFG